MESSSLSQKPESIASPSQLVQGRLVSLGEENPTFVVSTRRKLTGPVGTVGTRLIHRLPWMISRKPPENWIGHKPVEPRSLKKQAGNVSARPGAGEVLLSQDLFIISLTQHQVRLGTKRCVACVWGYHSRCGRSIHSSNRRRVSDCQSVPSLSRL